MCTNIPGSFSDFLNCFVLAKLATTSIRFNNEWHGKPRILYFSGAILGFRRNITERRAEGPRCSDTEAKLEIRVLG